MSFFGRFRRRQTSKEQSDWLGDITKPKAFPNFNDWASKQRGNFSDYLAAFEQQLNAGPTIIEVRHIADENRKSLLERLSKIDKFGIAVYYRLKGEIDDKLLARIDIFESTQLKLRNCTIKEIFCHGGHSSANLTLIDCWVGVLMIEANSLSFLEMLRGGVRVLKTPLPSQGNPFTGSVSISDVNFAPALENTQSFRNLRHHLTSIHNQEAASVFHSAEMRTLFKKQNTVDKAFNLMYRAISDYGNSTIRPLLLFLVFALSNFLIFFFSDGAAVPNDVADTGWQLVLHNNGEIGNAVRSATITLTQIVNPLGVFGLKSLVIAKSALLVVSNTALCFFATASLAFFVLALRRRFRIAQS